MKKTKYLALVLVVAIMMMGAGYAAWTDKLVIKNTVEAGELNVEFATDKPGYPIAVVTDGTSTNHANAIIEHGDKITTVTINNIYPGVSGLYRTRFINKGTIPAVISGVNIDSSKTSAPLNKELMLETHIQYWTGKDGTMVKEKSTIITCSLGGYQTAINDHLKNMILEKGHEIRIDTSFNLPLSVVNEDGVEKEKAIFNIEFNFKQHNVE